MGFRFRKSFKIAPGVKFNIGKKSSGISIGGKHGGVSFNTRSGARARVSAPGTGLSYSTKISGNSKKSTGRSNKSSSGSSNGGGCLITCLKICGIIILIPLVMAFGWIAGIIWLIAFRKKMESEPEKQKKYTVGISILSVISLIFMIYCFCSPSDTTTNDTTNEAVESTEVYTAEEQESVLDEFTQTEVESIEDTEIESETETDEIQKSDENSTSNSNTVEINSISTQQEQPDSVDQQNNEQAQEQPIQSFETQNNVMVWVDDTAAKYHKKNGCGMNNAYQVTLEEAQAMGKTPCGRCYK